MIFRLKKNQKLKKVSGSKILLLEDEPALSKAIKIMLESEGHAVTLVRDGEYAIAEFDEGSFDLAILDLITPYKNGFEVLDYIRQKNSSIPIFIVSNLSHKEDMNEALEKGANKFFVKSDISLEKIAKEVNETLT